MAGYDVIVRRFRSDLNSTELPIPGLQRIFGLDGEAAMKVVHSSPCVVRTSVPLQVARRYAEALRSLGGEVEIRESRVDPAAAKLPQPAIARSAPPSGGAPEADPAPAVCPNSRTVVERGIAATDPAPSSGSGVSPGAVQPPFDTTADCGGSSPQPRAAGSEPEPSVGLSRGADQTFPLGTLGVAGADNGPAAELRPAACKEDEPIAPQSGPCAELRPVAWTEDEPIAPLSGPSLELEDVEPARARSQSPAGASERVRPHRNIERPWEESLADAVRSNAGAGAGAVSKAPDPMRAAFISNESVRPADREEKGSAVGDGALELAVQPGPRRRFLTLSDARPSELPAPLRALSGRMGFIKPGMGDILGGLWIVGLGLWIGGSTFLGSPGVTDVMFDAIGFGWLSFGVYRLTTGSRGQ